MNTRALAPSPRCGELREDTRAGYRRGRALGLVVGVGLLHSVKTQTVLVSPSAVPILSTATPAASASVSPAVASLASGLVTYEDLFLGFRISLPVTYRPSASMVFAGQDDLGWGSYTFLAAAEERAECLRPKSDIPSPVQAAYRYLHASRNVDGMTAAQWVNTPRCGGGQPVSHFQAVVPLTPDGREAVKLVARRGFASTDIAPLTHSSRSTRNAWSAKPFLE